MELINQNMLQIDFIKIENLIAKFIIKLRYKFSSILEDLLKLKLILKYN